MYQTGQRALSAPDVVLETPRLRLRAWRDTDLAPFAALNANPRVMEHFPAVLSREASDLMATRIRAQMFARGFGFWAVDAPGRADFIGFDFLHPSLPADHPLRPHVLYRKSVP